MELELWKAIIKGDLNQVKNILQQIPESKKTEILNYVFPDSSNKELEVLDNEMNPDYQRKCWGMKVIRLFYMLFRLRN